jgi:hypothetical protein
MRTVPDELFGAVFTTRAVGSGDFFTGSGALLTGAGAVLTFNADFGGGPDVDGFEITSGTASCEDGPVIGQPMSTIRILRSSRLSTPSRNKGCQDLRRKNIFLRISGFSFYSLI